MVVLVDLVELINGILGAWQREKERERANRRLTSWAQPIKVYSFLNVLGYYNSSIGVLLKMPCNLLGGIRGIDYGSFAVRFYTFNTAFIPYYVTNNRFSWEDVGKLVLYAFITCPCSVGSDPCYCTSYIDLSPVLYALFYCPYVAITIKCAQSFYSPL